MRPQSHRRPTAQHRAAEALRAAILEGELQPGQRINQEAWSERVGVSMIPLREALRGLAGEGLLTYRPRRGFVVTQLDLADLEEVYALRRLLETEAIRRGVPQANEGDVTRLRAAADACRLAARRDDLAGLLEANRTFHELIHGLARSGPLLRLVSLLWDSTEAYRALYYALPGEAAEAHDAHDAIVDAVARRDADAVVDLQDGHRERALERLRVALAA